MATTAFTNRIFRPAAVWVWAGVLLVTPARAWDYEGHRVVNQLALAALPANFSEFVRSPAAAERVAFLSGEPDRWRNVNDDVSLAHASGPDHYFDLEQLADYGLTPQTVAPLRYDFAAQLARSRAAHPEKFPALDPLKNRDHTRELIGFAPWAITENCGKLRSGFSSLKAFQDYGGTPEEIANAQASIIYVMGVMGHYVADCAQPLHVTQHHHGWVGENSHHYSTNYGVHAWIDGGFFRKTGGLPVEQLARQLRPAKIVGNPLKPEDLFQQVMAYLLETQQRVEPLYQLEQAGKFSTEGAAVKVGREFLDAQLVRGGQMLGDLWFSAWQQAAEDRFLIARLKERSPTPAGKQ